MPESHLSLQERIDYRTRIFNKEEIIPTAIGKVYEVRGGGVKIMNPPTNLNEEISYPSLVHLAEARDMFEVYKIKQFAVSLENDTKITFHSEVDLVELDKLDQYRLNLHKQLEFQRDLTRVLASRYNKERIFSLLHLLKCSYPSLSYHGEIPGNLTHGEMAETIGSTRVTVTRLMGVLRKELRVKTKGDNVNFLIPTNLRI